MMADLDNINPVLPSLVFATRTQTNYSAIQGILGASPIQIQGKTYVVTISSLIQNSNSRYNKS